MLVRPTRALLKRMALPAFLLPAQIPPPPKPLAPDIEDLHTRACGAGEDTYVDPSTGYQVFTALSHIRRNKCCGSACRHCPFAHANVGKKVESKYRSSGTTTTATATTAGSSTSAGAAAASTAAAAPTR